MRTGVLRQPGSAEPPLDEVLEAADRLFYRHGVQAVGMDALRREAGVSLRRLYALYRSKDALVAAYLDGRDRRWRAWLREAVEARSPDPAGRPLAVFDALEEWFSGPDFRGCALVNAVAELGDSSASVRRQAEEHKRGVRAYLAELLRGGGRDGDPEAGAADLLLLVDGAIAQAALGDRDAAARAAALARRLLAD